MDATEDKKGFLDKLLDLFKGRRLPSYFLANILAEMVFGYFVIYVLPGKILGFNLSGRQALNLFGYAIAIFLIAFIFCAKYSLVAHRHNRRRK